MNRSQRRTAARDARRARAAAATATAARHPRARAVAAVGSAAALASTGAGAAVLLAGTAAHANPVIEVTNTNPTGPGSLRDAIDTANTTPGQDEIHIGVTGTVTLTSNLPEIYDGVSIVGPGSGSFTIDGQDSFGTLRFYGVTSGPVTISGLTVTGSTDAGVYVGRTTHPVTIDDVVSTANDRGGCWGGFTFYSDPTTVTLTNVVASDNRSICDGAGILIANYGDEMNVTITGSRITGNTTNRSANSGGGMAVIGAVVTVTDTEISDNATTGSGTGGGVEVRDSTLTLDHVTITGNDAGGWGGGLSALDSTVTVAASTIGDNTAGSFGGGVRTGGSTTLVVTGSTIAGNEALYGAGLYLISTGSRTIADSTISGNHASRNGGGMVVGSQGPTALLSSTVTANTADGVDDGILVWGAGESLATTASIIAGNGETDLGGFGATPVTIASDHSLLGVVESATVTLIDAGGTRTGVTAPQLALGPLADNGGPTRTHALLAGSVAIDTGGTTAPDFPGNAWDQRGEGYARMVAGVLDVGAYEVQPPPPEPVPEPTFTG